MRRGVELDPKRAQLCVTAGIPYMLDASEAASFLHISEVTLRKKAKLGEIHPAKLGKDRNSRLLFNLADLIEYVNECKGGD